MYPKNAASPEPIAIGAVVQISDGAVQTSGCTVRIKPIGVAEGDGAGTTAYSTDGIVEYTPTQAETNYTSFILIAKKTGCIPVCITVVTSASGVAGYAGLDWAKVNAPTTSLALTGTTIATTQKVDVDTIKTQAVTCGAGVTVNPSVGTTANTTTHLNTIFDTDYATLYDTTNKAFLCKLGNFAMGGSSLALTTGAISGTTLTMSGAVALQSTLTVTGATSLAALSTSGTTTFNALTVTNATTLSGAVSLGSTLTITGATSLAALSTSGTTTLNALTVTNATTLSGAVSLGSTLTITGGTTLAALSMTTLTASGAVALQSTLAITGAFTATNASNSIIGIALHATQAAYAPATATALATVQSDTDDIQTRLPAALTANGLMKSDTLRIGGTLQTAYDVGNGVFDIQSGWDIAYDGINGVLLCNATRLGGVASQASIRAAIGMAGIATYDTDIASLATATNLAEANADLDELITTIGPAGAGLTAVALTSTGLDSIAVTAPSGVASTFPGMIVQLWRRFFKKSTLTSTQLKTYADDGTTVVTTQTVSDDGTTQTQGTSS